MTQPDHNRQPRVLRVIHAALFTPQGCRALHGPEMGALHHIPDAEVEVTDGVITYVGRVRPGRRPGARVINAGGAALLPGFVDSHTHMVFGGYRPEEFMWRMRGDTYMSIMERGGGIVSTMDATRRADSSLLEAKTRRLLGAMSRMGVTTVEGKSGYGLDRKAELTQLEVMARIAADPEAPVGIVATYLGAHALAPEWKGDYDAYTDMMIAEMLPEVSRRGLAACCDVFCERGVFSPEQSRRLLEEAARLGFRLKLHADEIVCTGGAELAVSLGALSADHLLHVSDEGISVLAGSDTVATLLPLTAFTLREPYAPARRMIDAGCAVALATDLNPGSCCSGSVPLTFALACIYMGMSVEEAVTAFTLNGAAALGLADTVGSVEVGKSGDFVLLCGPTPSFLPYYTAMNCVAMTVRGGRVVSDRRDVSLICD